MTGIRFRMLRTLTIAVVAICFSDGAFASDRRRAYVPAPIQEPAFWSRPADTLKRPLRPISRKQGAARRLAADRDPYADPSSPYKANRLSLPWATEPILNIPWANHRPHETSSRRHERHEPQGRHALNRGRDGWKISRAATARFAIPVRDGRIRRGPGDKFVVSGARGNSRTALLSISVGSRAQSG